MADEQEHDLNPATKDQAIEDRAQELRSELEQLGRWGIVTWCDEDIVTALERAGADATPENIRAVREHYYVDCIDDRMTEVGFVLIEEAIHDLGLATGGDEGGRVIRGLCVAQLSEARWWVPSLKKTVTSVDRPTEDAEFIKNVAYRECGKPGVQWDERANIRSKDGGGWLCADHAEPRHPPSEEDVHDEGAHNK
jgi:hypothetical protein